MTFDEMNLSKPLRNALADLELTTPTTIQRKVFSPIMSGKDVVGIAQTGTGKTFAYLLPSLRLWKFSNDMHPQVMIIVPTRELVAQVVEETQKLTKYMNVHITGAYGGTNINTQRAAVFAGVDVIVGTPGRLLDLMLDGVLKAKLVKRLIIDEVDEMLNLGFRAQLKNIIDFLPEKRQNLMFSATITESVEKVIDEYSPFYAKIEAAPSGTPLDGIDQFGFRVPNFNSKANLLEHLIKEDEKMQKVLVFAATKKMADALYERMEPVFEEKVRVIHSSKSQNNRFASVEGFQKGEVQLLIATDIIARGLDVSMVSHVVNFDMPEIAEQYIHRIGRTGRAEQKGISYAFVAEAEEEYLSQVENLMGKKVTMQELDEAVVISTELIPLEMPKEFVPFNNHKAKQHKQSEGGTFHEKKEKNKKTNSKIPYAKVLKQKYKKAKTRGDKFAKSKQKKRKK